MMRLKNRLDKIQERLKRDDFKIRLAWLEGDIIQFCNMRQNDCPEVCKKDNSSCWFKKAYPDSQLVTIGWQDEKN